MLQLLCSQGHTSPAVALSKTRIRPSINQEVHESKHKSRMYVQQVELNGGKEIISLDPLLPELRLLPDALEVPIPSCFLDDTLTVSMMAFAFPPVPVWPRPAWHFM